MLYQGEDITFKLAGDDKVNFIDNYFTVLIYANDMDSNSTPIVISKDSCTRVTGENAYTYTIASSHTKGMSGSYNIEVLLTDEESKRTIYKQDGAFSISYARIKDL